MALPPARPVVLTGARVVLSVPVETDVDRVTELCQDPAIAAWTTIPHPYGRADAESFVGLVVPDGWVSGRSCTWAIRVPGDVGAGDASAGDAAAQTLVGMIGLDAIADGQAEVGFWLAPEARGRGIMTEAVALVLDFAFAAAPTGLGVQRVVWHAFVGNRASAAVARRAGFQYEGLRRLGAVQRGARRDDWQAGLLREDPREPADGWPAGTLALP